MSGSLEFGTTLAPDRRKTKKKNEVQQVSSALKWGPQNTVAEMGQPIPFGLHSNKYKHALISFLLNARSGEAKPFSTSSMGGQPIPEICLIPTEKKKKGFLQTNYTELSAGY